MRPTDQKATAIGKIVCYSYIVPKRRGDAMPGGVAWECTAVGIEAEGLMVRHGQGP